MEADIGTLEVQVDDDQRVVAIWITSESGQRAGSFLDEERFAAFLEMCCLAAERLWPKPKSN